MGDGRRPFHARRPCRAALDGDDRCEIQVYGAGATAPGNTMVELHSDSALQGTTGAIDGIRPTQGAVHETLEITHGWTHWFDTGFYIFTSLQQDQGWEWAGNHVRPKIRVPEE